MRRTTRHGTRVLTRCVCVQDGGGGGSGGADAAGPTPVDEWLRKIRLEQYGAAFRKHVYLDMARVRRIWEVELTALLEIGKVGHRRRMLASVSGGRRQLRSGSLNPDASLSLSAATTPTTPGAPLAATTPTGSGPQVHVPSSATLAPNPTGTLRHSKKSRPAPPPPQSGDLSIRDPIELLEGVPGALTTTWRHRPVDLVGGGVTYLANVSTPLHLALACPGIAAACLTVSRPRSTWARRWSRSCAAPSPPRSRSRS